MQTENACI